jgi:hypothetical protein
MGKNLLEEIFTGKIPEFPSPICGNLSNIRYHIKQTTLIVVFWQYSSWSVCNINVILNCQKENHI